MNIVIGIAERNTFAFVDGVVNSLNNVIALFIVRFDAASDIQIAFEFSDVCING